LWQGQTDEGEMGMSYEALDRFILTGEGDADLTSKVENMIRNSEHKRTTPPIGTF